LGQATGRSGPSAGTGLTGGCGVVAAGVVVVMGLAVVPLMPPLPSPQDGAQESRDWRGQDISARRPALGPA